MPECPKCRSMLDAATGITDVHAIPKPGDISVCFDCGEILIFDPDMSHRVLTLGEELALDDDASSTVRKVRQSILKFRVNVPTSKK